MPAMKAEIVRVASASDTPVWRSTSVPPQTMTKNSMAMTDTVRIHGSQ